MSLVVNFIRGSKNETVTIKKCGNIDIAILSCFFVFMLALSILGVAINRREHALKKKVGRGLVPSDIQYNGK